MMSKTTRTCLLLLCICLFALKGMSAQRFVENGLKRAQVYATYYDPFADDAEPLTVKSSINKENLTLTVSIHLAAILVGFIPLIFWGRLKSYLRPVVKSLPLAWIHQRIFRPPKLMYLPY